MADAAGIKQGRDGRWHADLHAERRPGAPRSGCCSGVGEKSFSPFNRLQSARQPAGECLAPSGDAIEAMALRVVQGRLPYPRPHRSPGVARSNYMGQVGPSAALEVNVLDSFSPTQERRHRSRPALPPPEEKPMPVGSAELVGGSHKKSSPPGPVTFHRQMRRLWQASQQPGRGVVAELAIASIGF